MFKCGIFACEEMHADEYNTIGFKYMETAIWQYKISMYFYMKLYFKQIFQVYMCLGLDV